MKPMIETTIFNTEKDGRGQVIADLLAYDPTTEGWTQLDTDIMSFVVDSIQMLEEEELPHQYEIKIFTGDLTQVKKPSSPKTLYLQGPWIAVKMTYLSGL